MHVLGDHHRALCLLAGSPEGTPVSLLLSHGVRAKCITTLVQAGFATTHPAQVIAGDRVVEVVRYRVTALGRVALGRPSKHMTDDDAGLRFVFKMASDIDEDLMVANLIEEVRQSSYEIVKKPGL